MWYDSFSPDRDGWITSGRGGGGGHALCGYGLAQRNGAWGIRTRNSWGPTWGVGGNCILAEPLFGNEIGGYWAVRSVVQSVNPPVGVAGEALAAPFRPIPKAADNYSLTP